jgi:hypothetical protein
MFASDCRQRNASCACVTCRPLGVKSGPRQVDSTMRLDGSGSSSASTADEVQAQRQTAAAAGMKQIQQWSAGQVC